MAYWFSLDMDLVKGDTRQIVLTFKTQAGAPVSIAAWTFYYKAVKVDDSTVTLTVANASMTQSNSGMGVTDTVTIPLDNSVSSIAAGRYSHEIAVKISGEPTTIAKGTLNIPERITVVV
jgi:hypothetical protein